ncbi:MAG TPA: hypothetical protein VI279_05670 [Rhodocyclaceae bacterium]
MTTPFDPSLLVTRLLARPKTNPAKQKHIPLLLALAALLSACTTVSIVDRDGTTKVSREFGFVSIELNPRAGTAAAAFQAAKGLPVDGEVGPTTRLFSATALRSRPRSCP